MRLGAALFAVFSSLLLTAATAAQGASPRDEFKQLVELLQKNPNDHALRERVITLAQRIKPAPAIPEEARRYFIRGNALVKEAKTATDADAAIGEYRNSLNVAPWWADPYFNLSRAQEIAQKYDEAIRSLRFYLLTHPQDARQVQDRLYELEAKQEAAKRKHAEAETQAAAEKLASPEGRWGERPGEGDFIFERRNGIWYVKLHGKETTAKVMGRSISFRTSCGAECYWDHDYMLSDDGKELRGRCRSAQSSERFDQDCVLYRQ